MPTVPFDFRLKKSKPQKGKESASSLKFTADDALQATSSVAKVVASVSDMLSFPPTSVAASILHVILETIQKLKANKTSCYELARRATAILAELKARMEGRLESAPKALVESVGNFKL